MKVNIPAKINNTNVSIVIDLVNDDIPLLLSKEIMKKANAHINFSSDSVFMFGNKQPKQLQLRDTLQYLLVKGYL